MKRHREQSKKRSTSPQSIGPQKTPRYSSVTSDLTAVDRAASYGNEDSLPIAMIENRASEIGVAVFDQSRQKLLLSQYIETSLTYATTHTFLQRYFPDPLILVDEQTKSRAGGLTHATRSDFKQYLLPRNCFDDARGEIRIEMLAMQDGSFSSEVGMRRRKRHYLAIGSAHALLAYLENVKHLTIREGTLDIEYLETANYLQLDVASIECLGIANPSKVVDRMNSPSLFKTMNRTKTTCGAKLLKANLLQPLRHIPTLNLRYAAVEELIEGDDLQAKCTHVLETIPADLDKLCSIFVIHASTSETESRRSVYFQLAVKFLSYAVESRETENRPQRISTLIDGVLLVRDMISTVCQLREVLCGVESELLKSLAETIGHCVFDEILKDIHSAIDEHATRRKASILKQIELCFAVKAGYDAFLDAARANISIMTEEIHSLANRLREEHCLEHIKVSYSGNRGFSFQVIVDEDSTDFCSSIPDEWVVIEKRGKKGIHCIPQELISLNARHRSAAQECLQYAHEALERVAESIVQKLTSLRKLIDAVALLDMLVSIADLAVNSPSKYVKPRIFAGRRLAIVAGRHPVYETMEEVDFCANDLHMSPFATCCIITGPNMSGKSTYLKQVALMIVMAQIGSFVPADDFAFRPHDRLFTRMGFSDSIEANSSSFMVEMQEMAFILNNVTKDSVVFIDELGRATNTIDGEGIAWSVCEKLLKLGPFSLVATHLNDIRQLPLIYPTASLHQFDVALDENGLRFNWKLRPLTATETAAMRMQNYGIELAKFVNFPPRILDRAKEISIAVHDAAKVKKQGRMIQVGDLGEIEAQMFYGVMQQLYCLATSEDCADMNATVELIRKLRNDLAAAMKS